MSWLARTIVLTFLSVLALPHAARGQTENSNLALASATGPVENNVDFRVTTQIFTGKEESSSAKHLILFSGSLVYDIAKIDQEQITVYDLERNRVILLDPSTKVRSIVEFQELIKMTAQVRAQATEPREKERLGLAVKIMPIVIDPSSGKAEPIEISDDGAKIASDGFMTRYGDVQYEVLTQKPRSQTIAKRYAVFADTALRLNVARRIGSSPFGRMTLNDHIASMGQIPRETTLTIRRPLSQDRYRSTHELIEQLSESDRAKIYEIGGMSALYREVPLAEFP
jgi:hypothetical protein